MPADMGTDLIKLFVNMTTTGTGIATIMTSMTDEMTETVIEEGIAIEIETGIAETSTLAKNIARIPCRLDHPVRSLRHPLNAIKFSILGYH
jgi:hypothetical protein